MANRNREGTAHLEYRALLASRVFRGTDVPRGDGTLVLVIPGLFGNDFYLQPLLNWLQRIGYQTMPSSLSWNAGCAKRLAAQVERSLNRRLRRHEGDVAIVGHSRGGMLGKALANRLGDRCSRFVALGSPVGGVMRHGPTPAVFNLDVSPQNRNLSTTVGEAGKRITAMLDPDCEAPECGCDYMLDLTAPFPAGTHVTSIYSSEDPVVAPTACPIDGAENIEVTGTHSGLVFSQQVYPHLASALLPR